MLQCPLTGKRHITHGVATAIFAGIFVAASSTAVCAEESWISWDDLVPASEPLEDPLASVDMRIRFDIGFVAQVRADIERGAINESAPEARNAAAIAQSLVDQGIDVEPLIADFSKFNAEIAQRQSGLVSELDGQRVTLPGYALPLELSSDGVREFLLVPYVGACIHVPPPPPNQTVFVASDEGVEIDGLFQAVQVTGLLEIETGSRSLSFVDGSADVATGYTLSEVAVEPYSP